MKEERRKSRMLYEKTNNNDNIMDTVHLKKHSNTMLTDIDAC